MLHLEGKLLALPANIRLGCKCSPGINALPYLPGGKEKKFNLNRRQSYKTSYGSILQIFVIT